MAAAPRIREVNKRPDVQYVLAFFVGLAVIWLANFLGGLVPLYRLVPLPQSPVPSPQAMLWTNIAIDGVSIVIPILVIVGCFLLFCRGMRALGVKNVTSKAMWQGAVVAIGWTVLANLAYAVVYPTVYTHVPVNSQVAIDASAFVAMAAGYIPGWWSVRRMLPRRRV